MRCDLVEREILERDAGAVLSPEAVAHLARCARCRRLAEAVASVADQLRLAAPADVDEIDLIMSAIHARAPQPAGPHSLARWLVGGLLLIVGLLALPHSRTFALLAEAGFGPRFELSATVVFGLLLVGYLATFVLANRERLDGLLERLSGARNHLHR